MPVTTQNELMQAVVGGEIGAISIDTSVFESYKFGFEVGVLAQLSQFSRSDIEHLLVDMVHHEVRDHLVVQGKEDRARVKNALKPLLNSWGLSVDDRNATLHALFGAEDEVARTEQRLASFIKLSSAVLLDSKEFADLTRIVDLYFRTSPPFGEKEAKKHEFPDAFALVSLEGWARRNDKAVLVVAKDNDWRKFCESSELLFYADDLTKALSAFHAGADVAARMFARAVEENRVENIDATVMSALNEQADKIEVEMEATSNHYFESELTHVEISSAALVRDQLADLEVVDYENNELLLRINLLCNVEAQFSVSFDHWDSIDKEYVGLGSATVEKNEQIELEVLITVIFQNGEAIIEKVELITMMVGMEFGDLEPDWMHEAQ